MQEIHVSIAKSLSRFFWNHCYPRNNRFSVFNKKQTFPFSDLTAVKQRPCLILCILRPKGLDAHYVVSMMTSSISGIRFPFDVPLTDWKKAGLPKKTIVRLAKLVTIDAFLVRKQIGRLSANDTRAVQKNFTRMFSAIVI